MFQLSVELGTPSQFQITDSEEPTNVDFSAGSKLQMFIRVVVAVSALLTMVTVIVLYFQIALLVHTRIAPQTAEHDQSQQMREPELPALDLFPQTSNPQGLAEEGDNAIPKQGQWWDVGMKDIHQVRDDEDEDCSMDQNCVSVISMNDIPLSPVDSYSARTQYSQDNIGLEVPVTLSNIEIIKGVPGKTSFENPMPLQLPGAVFSSHVNNDHEVTEEESERRRPTVLSLTTSHDVPPIPDLGNNVLENCSLYKKVTLMLFIATLVTIGTNVGLLAMPLMDSKIVLRVFLNISAVRHAANPFIYSIVNKSFRDDCKIVF